MRKKRNKTKSQTPRQKLNLSLVLRKLIKKALRLAEQEVYMPIDEVHLGNEIALNLYLEKDISLVQKSLLSHDNFHVPRVGAIALRKLGKKFNDRLIPIFIELLNDSQGWIRYEAAWALGDIGSDDPQIISALKKLAGKAMKPSMTEPDTSSSAEKAAIRDAESLVLIESKCQQIGEFMLEEFVDQDIGYTLRVPSSWQRIDDQIMALSMDWPEEPLVTIKCLVKTLDKPICAAEVADSNLELYKSMWTLKDRKSQSHHNDGDMVVLELEQKLPMAVTKQHKLYLVKGTRLLILTCSSPKQWYEQFRNMFVQIVFSARLLR